MTNRSGISQARFLGVLAELLVKPSRGGKMHDQLDMAQMKIKLIIVKPE